MKPNIHPTYYTNVKVTCACGNTFETGSTIESIQTEICSACHPFYTGTAKLIETGQVDKFKMRLERTKAVQGAVQPKKKPGTKVEKPIAEADLVKTAPKEESANEK